MAVPEFYSGKILYPAIAVLIALSGLFGLLVLPRFAPAHGGLIGQQAPNFVLPVTANGEEGSRVDLSALRGHAVILDFWASWCGPCAMEAPMLDRLSRRYEKKGLVVVGVNVSDPPGITRQYAAKKGLSFTMVSDAAQDAQAGYGVEKLPSLVIIDKEGKIAAFFVGVTDESSIEDVVNGIM